MMRGTSLSSQAAAIVMLTALAACSPADCDPSRAELFTGIGCAASGSYAARETGLRNGLAAAQANELERQAQANQAASDAANAQRELTRKRDQLAMLDGRLNALKRELDAARRRQGVDQDALHRAQAELAALQARRAQVTPQSNDAELRALEGPTRELGEKLNRDGLQ
jgi:chromosome segregation ATPase